jgi:hypothetical protein
MSESALRLTIFRGVVASLTVMATARAADHGPAAFPKGTLTLQAYGTYADGLDNSGSQVESGAVGASYYVFDNISLGLEASGYATRQGGRSGEAFGLAGVLRDHLLTFDRFTLFSDVTFGPSQDSVRIPTDGTYFNFMTRTGLGLTYQLQDHLYLLGGVRYFHLSNADLDGRERNPSINGIEGFFGFMWKI